MKTMEAIAVAKSAKTLEIWYAPEAEPPLATVAVVVGTVKAETVAVKVWLGKAALNAVLTLASMAVLIEAALKVALPPVLAETISVLAVSMTEASPLISKEPDIPPVASIRR